MLPVSVVVPVYNASGTVRRTLESLLAQTQPVEIVVVLDSPTDESPVIVNAMAAENHLIRVLSLPANEGLAAARRVGTEAASGAWVGYVDADDVVCPDMFETMYAAGVSSGADIVSCALTRVEGGRERRVPFPLSPGVHAQGRIREALKSAHTSHLIFFAVRNLYRRSFLEAHGVEWDPSLRTGEDLPFNLKAYGYAKRLVVVPEPLYVYEQTPNSLTTAKHVDYLPGHLQASTDLKLRIASELGFESEFYTDMNQYILTNSFPRLLLNEAAREAVGPRAAATTVLQLPMIRNAVRATGLSDLPRGIQIRLVLARARQATALGLMAKLALHR